MKNITLRTTRLCAALGLAMAALGAQAAADTTRVVVSFSNAEASANLRGAVARLGGVTKVDLSHINAVAVEVPTKALPQLRKLAGVKSVEVDAKRYLEPNQMTTVSANELLKQLDKGTGTEGINFEGENTPYGIRQVQAGAKLPNAGAEPIKVCVIDSGLDSRHPDFANIDGAWDSVAGGWDELPLGMHGTHTAGTIAAQRNGMGVVGVASRGEVSLYIVRVFNGADTWAYSSSLAAATQVCKAAGAKVINMSLGGAFPNSAERANFDQLEADGVLSIASSGNSGSRTNNYPASYQSVVAVAATDRHAQWASFSTFNAQVELSAPGAGVASTVPLGAGRMSTLGQNGAKYSSLPLAGSAATGLYPPVIAATYDFGLGTAVDAGAAGKVCVISRGSVSFADKAANCQNSGGVAAIIYNNAPGNFNGTLGTMVATIPVVSISDTDGAAMVAAVPAAARVRVVAMDYAYLSGTSMAAPHVTGVAARLWQANPECTNTQIRDTLDKSAKDMNEPGRDEKTGFGLVQLRDANDRIQAMGCGN